MRDRQKAARVTLATVGQVAGVAGAMLVLGSCGAPAATGPLPPPAASVPVATEAPAAAAPAPAETAGHAAVAAYRGMWQAMARAGETSDPLSPELSRYAAGEALTSIKRSLYADRQDGVVTWGAPTVAPVVRSAEPLADPAMVLIEDCGDSTNSLKYYAGTTRPAGDGSGGGRRAIRAEVMRQPDGSWRVTRFAVRGLGSC